VAAVTAETPQRIANRERLIFALDVPDFKGAQELVNRLGDSVTFYKIGLELATSRHYFELLDWLVARDKKVFADLKLYDIPATVSAAVRQLSRTGATFLTVHGDPAVAAAAASAKGASLKVLAVTVLTSVAQADLSAMGITLPVEELVLSRARQAVAAGCDGVIASGLEAAPLRKALPDGALIVTPGIRPASSARTDDQQRVVTPTLALRSGASYIVVGRPIRDAADPYRAAAAIQEEIAAVFG
jgi:orotidine-5'-phosphate decarboxylase